MSYAAWDTRGRKTTEERYWSYVDKTPDQGPWGDCWGWKGSTVQGYGQLGGCYWQEGRRTPNIRAHVFSYQLHIGQVPEGLEVSHMCHNPACSNPDHLIAETSLENIHRSVVARDARRELSFSEIIREPSEDSIAKVELRLMIQEALGSFDPCEYEALTAMGHDLTDERQYRIWKYFS